MADRDQDLSDEIVARWDPERLLRLVSNRAGKGERLDVATRSYFERKLGVDLGGVRVYTGEFAEEVTRARSAEALTIGTTGMILMRGSSERSMGSAGGRALMAHELTHVAQEQRQVHRRATFGEATPLASEQHEAEAEEAEAAEHHAARGGEGADAAAAEAAHKELKERVKERVLEMLGDSARTRLMRNGEDSWRP